ncbi:predicted protein [Nematostella vectensis]|uniref:G-protein coupled receptors family 1 profile domain-containing protein n=1 Tax=Nematostella vectensis TaxID=45351 RepID=A7STR3_NEMVE|nr:predicted protein [Nematostella vectensis]|eukprot:XP_001625005.1 predicted protein [Nematostella vectensis]
MEDFQETIAAVTVFIMSLALLVSLPANIAILAVFYREPKVRVPSGIFVLNMAWTGVLGAVVFVLLIPDLYMGVAIAASNPAACSAREFLNEMYSALTLFAVLLVTGNRYAVVVLKHRYQAYFTRCHCALYVGIAWLLALAYAAGLTITQSQNAAIGNFKCKLGFIYPESVAAVQLTFLGVLFILTIGITGALGMHFYSQRKVLPLPLNFYSKESIERRMAPGKERRIAKNLRVLTIALASILGCFGLQIGGLVLAVSTGRWLRMVYTCGVTCSYCACLIHPYLFGYLNRRLKQPMRRLCRRACNAVFCTHSRTRKLTRVESSLSRMESGMPRVESGFSFDSSKLRIIVSTDEPNESGVELTRSKMDLAATRHLRP